MLISTIFKKLLNFKKIKGIFTKLISLTKSFFHKKLAISCPFSVVVMVIVFSIFSISNRVIPNLGRYSKKRTPMPNKAQFFDDVFKDPQII